MARGRRRNVVLVPVAALAAAVVARAVRARRAVAPPRLVGVARGDGDRGVVRHTVAVRGEELDSERSTEHRRFTPTAECRHGAAAEAGAADSIGQ